MEKRSDEFCKRFLKAADEYLERNQLEKAEHNFASALRQVHNRPKDKLYEIAAALRGLGFVYKERGRTNQSGEDMVKATGLFIASLTRLREHSKHEPNTDSNLDLIVETVHLQDEIESVHANFITETLLLQQSGLTNDYQRVEHYKETLHHIRETCRLKINVLDKLSPLDPRIRNVSVEKERAQLTERVYTEISKSMKELVTSMVDDCIEVMSSPPCRYSVVGLGSTAKGEATPYSDLEFCILIEKDTEDVQKYFTYLTNFLHLKIVELGETILPSLGIRSLNNYYSCSSEDDWFFDEGRRGFSFDGTMPWASKVPTGRDKTVNKPWVQSLIKTPKDMADLLSETAIFNEGYHLADVLSTCVLLCGDKYLFEVYGVCKTKSLLVSEDITSEFPDSCCARSCEYSSCDKMSPWKQRILQELVEVERQYHTSLANYVRKEGNSYAMKQDFYRFPSLVVEYLGKYNNIESSSSWATIGELESNRYVSSEGAHNLRTALGIAAELRLRAYLDNESQNEYFSDLVKLVGPADAPENLSVLLLRFFFTVVPLEEAIKKVSKLQSLSHFEYAVLYDDNPKIEAQMYLQFRQHYKAKSILENLFAEKLRLSPNKDTDQNLAYVCKLLGNCLVYLENVPEAIKYHRMALDVNENIYKGTRSPVLPSLKNVADSRTNHGCCLLSLGEHERAISSFKRALEIHLFLLEKSSTRVEIVSCLLDVVDAQRHLSKAYSLIGEDNSRISLDKETLSNCEILLQKYDLDRSWHTVLYFNQGLVYYNLKKFQESANAYQKAVEMLYRYRRYDLYTEKEAGLLNNFGNAVIELGDLDKAKSLHNRAYEIRTHIHGTKDVDSLARSLNNFGLISERAGKFDEALEFYILARDMCMRINGTGSSYPHLQMYKRNASRVAEKCTSQQSSYCTIV